MSEDKKQWLDDVTKNIASCLYCPIDVADRLIQQTGEIDKIYDSPGMKFVAIATAEFLQLIRKNSKIQVRGTFTINYHVEKQKVRPFQLDLDLSEYEKERILVKGRNRYDDIKTSKIVEEHIVSLNIGYPEGTILILNLQFWANEGFGWFQIPYKI